MKQISTVEFEKRYNHNGYISIKVEGEWILEHLFVVEQFIGRKLDKNNVIHHINSNRKDNRIENLMIFPDQRKHCLFHMKVNQFGFTRPILRTIKERWEQYK